MSSKLVKKLLHQATTQAANNEHDVGGQKRSQNKRFESIPRKSTTKVSKEEMMQEHVQSLLRLDNLVQKYSSSTAKKSFDRHSSDLKHKQKQKLKTKTGGVGNSRSSSSSFSQKPHEKRFDKERVKRKKEEGYFEDLAKALKKAKKNKRKVKS